MAHIAERLREDVSARAGRRCEYCLEPEDLAFARHQVDHVIAEKHGGTTALENLALCCALCNRRKGSDLATLDPMTGELQALFHPRLERWAEHFDLRGGEIVPPTMTRRVTHKLLPPNLPHRLPPPA